MPFHKLTDGDRLYYEVHGDGPPLMLVTGLGGTASFWTPLVPAFAERFTVVLHDHRGTGQSSPSIIDYSVDQMADDVLQLMDGLGIESADYVGHSTGGAIGQTLAIDRPERIGRLVLSASWTAADGYFRRLFEVRANILRQGGVEAYVRSHALFMNPSWRIRDAIDEIERQEADAIVNFPKPEIMLSRIDAILRFDRRTDLSAIKAETLAICARDDITTPPYFTEELGRLIPGAHAVILPSGGHFFPQLFADDFVRTVGDFLEAPGEN